MEFPFEKPVLHEMPCPHCGAQEMVDDQAGGLHCGACGHEQQMGWDDPESWMEGKFDWDFNLPLEGMAEGDELAEPGERNWVVPTRDFGPRRHGGMEEWQEPGAAQEVYGAWRFGMPVTPEFWNQEPAPLKFGDLYHGTGIDRLPSIMKHGIQPWDSEHTPGHNYGEGDWLAPRPGHTYLAQDPRDAHDRGINAEVGHLPPGTVIDSPGERTITLKIDPSYLKPEHISPDEDAMNVPKDMGSWQNGYYSLGDMAEKMGWGDSTHETESQIEQGKHIGYRGVIPPEAITPGRYRGGEWRPLDAPPEPLRYANLIGEMRDGWGRFASGAPWEWGQWGKGIFFPETGTMHTWSDARTHPEVALEDEHASQGSGHHFVIRPNGTVKDQGAMDHNFESAEGDAAGLAMALRELDPRLRLDKPSDWDFGATEPMEEEPSSVSRGEDGGTIHGVQTGGDYAGSL